MQQASSSLANYPVPPGNFLPPAAAGPRFVVNLCSSTTPVGLVQPTHAGLKRFTFFVSRRLEEGRERFRLHMGYFDTQEEAEKILDLVRDVYPGAWAGAAPGIRLRARAAAAASAEAAPPAARASEPARASEREAVAAPAPVSAAVAPPAAATAPPVKIAAKESAPVIAPVVASPVAPVVAPTAAAPVAPAVHVAAPATVIQLELVPDRPRALPASIIDFEPKQDKENAAAARSLNDVRAAINSLDEVSGESSGVHTTIAPTVAMPAIVPTITRTAPPVARNVPTPVPTAVPMPVPAKAPTLEGAAVLRILETARPAPAAKARPIYAQAGTEQRPAATATQAPTAPRAEPALFAVQLLWSVQPIDMTKIPQLAIFSAYTLYGAEGNRDGRRWYGLRLGFFTDAVSAKQVAQYVRSEFTSVSVVPVSVRERARAGAATSKPLPPLSTAKNAGPELNFIEEVQTDTATSGSRPALQLTEDKKPAPPAKKQPELSPALQAAIAAVGVSKRTAPGGKRVKLRVAQGTKPVSKRPQKRALSLEETLEILGASELQVDNGRGELINDSSRRATARAPKTTPSGSRFGRLINRLAERLGNS